MNNVKIIIASDENKLREPLKKHFSDWGMETIELTKPPEISTVKALSPQLILMEKKYYGHCDLFSKSADEQFGKITKPGIVIVVKPTEKMPLISEVGHNNILKMPYSPLSLFNTIREALCFNQLESSLGSVLAKLDMIYDVILKEMNHIEEIVSTVNEPSFDMRDEILPKSKSIILSLLKEAQNNCELSPFEGQLHELEKYINELAHQDDDLAQVSNLLKEHPLSRKELKIFSMITNGMTTEEIAEKLFVSTETVKSHRRNIRKKLSLVGNKASLGEFVHHLSETDDKTSDIDTSLVIKPKKAEKCH